MNGFLGKDISHLTGFAINSIFSDAYDINMGYVDLHNRGKDHPFNSVKWREEENNFSHPWKLDTLLYAYGYQKLKEYFNGVNDYLNTRADVVDAIVSNVSKGEYERHKYEEELIAQEAKRRNKPKQPKGNPMGDLEMDPSKLI